MTKWYLSTDDCLKGPFTTDHAKIFVRENHGAYCWQQGFDDWKPAHTVLEIWPLKKNGTPFPSTPENMMSKKPLQKPVVEAPVQQNRQDLPLENNEIIKSIPTSDLTPTPSPRQGSDPDLSTQNENQSVGFGTNESTEGIDFHIYGHEMQYIEVELDPGESAIAEAGALMYKNESIEMETVFGDATSDQKPGLMSRLLGAGQRLLTGESLFITVFTQKQQGKGRVAFGAPFPGTIIPVNLAENQNKIICQKDSFLAGTKGVRIGIFFQKKIMTGLFGGEGFIMQKIEGDGWVFMHVGGAVKEINLAPGEVLHVDTGCLAAMTSTVEFEIMQAGGIKTMLFGDEGLFFAKITGPGKVWLQSLPFSRLAGRMLACAPGTGSKQQGEGSLLGSLGNLVGGK